MSDYYCPSCRDKWNHCYNLDGRCVTCGAIILAVEGWRRDRPEAAEEDESCQSATT